MTYSIEREFKDGDFYWGSISISLLQSDCLDVLIFNLKQEGHQTHMIVSFPEQNNLYDTIVCILIKLTKHIGHTGDNGIVFGYEDYIWSHENKVKLLFNQSTLDEHIMPLGKLYDNMGIIKGHVSHKYKCSYDGEPWTSAL